MAGIFNIFNESENRSSLSIHKGKEKSLPFGPLKNKSNGSTGLMATKNALQSQSKPKGLSIRSKSDLNVAVENTSALKKLNPNYSVFKEKSCISQKKAISPLKLKTPKRKSITNITPKKLSPNILSSKKLSPKMSSPIPQNVVDELTIFKKPSTPKQLKKPNKYCEPENLAYPFNEYNYMKDEMEQIFNDDRIFLRSVMKNNDSITSLEDEGFISDSSFDSYEDSNGSSSISLPSSNIELPDISDCED